MAQIQRIHADPSGNEAPQRAQTAASTNHGHETKSHRESPELRIRTGLPQMIRRNQLRLLVPLADSTIYEMEQRGEFPRRFSLTSRCVVWDLADVEAWIEQRKQRFLRRSRSTRASARCSYAAGSSDLKIKAIGAMTGGPSGRDNSSAVGCMSRGFVTSPANGMRVRDRPGWP